MTELHQKNKKAKVLVVFGERLPVIQSGSYDEIITLKKFESLVQPFSNFKALEDLVEPGSIYEATALVESLPKLVLPNGKLLSKSFLYKGYELWWIHYNDLFYYFGLPFAQYKKLLNHTKNFEQVDLYEPSFLPLFVSYLEAYDCKVKILARTKNSRFLPFGILIQIALSSVFLPLLIIKRSPILVFAGDMFEQGKDYDTRMKFVYRELRERKQKFSEFIRSLERWKMVISHAVTRKRPVMYSEAVWFVGKFLSFVCGGHIQGLREYGTHNFASIADPETKFRIFIGTNYLRGVYTDVWAIRIMNWIIKIIGVKAAYFSAALDRTYTAVLGCKLNNIPTAGILHGVASKYYNGYDFLPGFDGEKALSLDKYGVWSEWWREYYIKHGSTYKPEQLVVSGLMRPIEGGQNDPAPEMAAKSGPIRVLFVSEQLAVPQEVIPYLDALLKQSDLEILFTFRQHRDGFKNWLEAHRPEYLTHPRIKIASGGLAKAIEDSDVAVGSHSTATLEMLLKLKVPLFFQTNKWGDYYSLKEYDSNHTFFAENPEELVEKIRKVRTIPQDTLKDLQKKYFGNPRQNGSKWLVEEIISFAQQRKS